MPHMKPRQHPTLERLFCCYDRPYLRIGGSLIDISAVP